MTSLQKTGESLLRMDRRGRVRMTAQRRGELLAEYDRSGVSAAQFARLTGVSYQTLCGWLQRRKREQSPAEEPRSGAGAVKWIETVAQPPSDAPPAAAALRVELGAAAWMDIACAGQARMAAALLHELTKLRQGGLPC